MLHAKFTALCVEAELLPIEEVLHCGNRDWRRFLCSRDLDDLYIDERDQYSLDMYRMSENEFPILM